MKKRLSNQFKIATLGFFFLVAGPFFSLAQDVDDLVTDAKAIESVIKQIKINMLDEKWFEALYDLNSLIEKFPKSDQIDRAYFLKAKALSNIKGREEEAFKAYDYYITSFQSKDLPLWMEEAKIAKSTLARSLYLSGQKHYLVFLLDSLNKENNAVKAYTALQIVKLREKQASKKALPILIDFYIQEEDPIIKNEYALGIISVDPSKLPTIKHIKVMDTKGKPDKRVIVLEGEKDFPKKMPSWIILGIYSKKDKKDTVRIKLPISFAQAIINALPEKVRDEIKNEMREEGFDFDAFWFSLQNLEEKSIFRLEDDEEIVEIRIE